MVLVAGAPAFVPDLWGRTRDSQSKREIKLIEQCCRLCLQCFEHCSTVSLSGRMKLVADTSNSSYRFLVSTPALYRNNFTIVMDTAGMPYISNILIASPQRSRPSTRVPYRILTISLMIPVNNAAFGQKDTLSTGRQNDPPQRQRARSASSSACWAGIDSSVKIVLVFAISNKEPRCESLCP